METKTCRDCQNTKSLAEFRQSRSSVNGKLYYHSYCTTCVNVRKKASYQKNIERNRAHKREVYAADPEKYKQRMRDWARNNRSKLRILEAKDSERRREAALERIEFSVVWNRDRGTCQLCGKHLFQEVKFPDWDAPTIDHIVPITKGGLHIYGNVQLTCWRCNHSKNNNFE